MEEPALEMPEAAACLGDSLAQRGVGIKARLRVTQENVLSFTGILVSQRSFLLRTGGDYRWWVLKGHPHLPTGKSWQSKVAPEEGLGKF